MLVLTGILLFGSGDDAVLYAALPILAYETSEENATDALAEPVQAEVFFSHEDFFYEEGFALSFYADSDEVVAIYYTVDGSPPDE